ncbi:MAG TPA: TlpA disulfide reductase family protein [bacterium]|nr:TlpA disulfide reductase family protein [bacterium]
MTPVSAPRPRFGILEISLIVVLVAALGVLLVGRLPGGEPPNTLGPAVASSEFQQLGALPAINVATIEGRPISSADLAGKVTVLHFWGTRCGPCLQELPSLREEYRTTLAKHPELALVTLASDRDRAAVERFMQSRGVDFPVVLSDTPEAVGVWDALGVRQTPTTVIADGSGQIRWVGHKVPRNVAEIPGMLRP